MSFPVNLRVAAHHYSPQVLRTSLPFKHPSIRLAPREIRFSRLAAPIISHSYSTAQNRPAPVKAINLSRSHELSRIQKVVMETRDFSPLAGFEKARNVFTREALRSTWHAIMKKQPQLVQLEEVNFSKASFDAFCQALKGNTDLRAVHLQQISVNFGFTPNDLEKLLQSIEKHPSIKVLDLSYNKLDNDHAILIAQAIKDGRLPNIQHFSLSGNDIGNDAALLIFQAMRSKKYPLNKELDLSFNYLDLKGIEMIQRERRTQPSKFKVIVHLHGNNHKWAS